VRGDVARRVQWKAGPLFVGWEDDVERPVGPGLFRDFRCWDRPTRVHACVRDGEQERRYKSLCARV
jgi:hypothetical protein